MQITPPPRSSFSLRSGGPIAPPRSHVPISALIRASKRRPDQGTTSPQEQLKFWHYPTLTQESHVKRLGHFLFVSGYFKTPPVQVEHTQDATSDFRSEFEKVLRSDPARASRISANIVKIQLGLAGVSRLVLSQSVSSVWRRSESERALQMHQSVYAADVHSAFTQQARHDSELTTQRDGSGCDSSVSLGPVLSGQAQQTLLQASRLWRQKKKRPMDLNLKGAFVFVLLFLCSGLLHGVLQTANTSSSGGGGNNLDRTPPLHRFGPVDDACCAGCEPNTFLSMLI